MTNFSNHLQLKCNGLNCRLGDTYFAASLEGTLRHDWDSDTIQAKNVYTLQTLQNTSFVRQFRDSFLNA